MRNRSLTTIDLFSGAGGLSEGFKRAGFRVLVGNDFDEVAGRTFRHNHPGTDFLCVPIQDVHVKDILSLAGLQRGSLDVLIGGPPCQAFSVYNHQRGLHDERSGLFREYIRMVEGLMPKFLVMENVTGITSVGGGRAVDEIHQQLRSLGYYIEQRILSAEDYGVPQTRRRMFFIGTRDSQSIDWPEPTHGDALLPLVTVVDAIGDLPLIKMGGGSESMRYTRKPRSDYQRVMRTGSEGVFNHVAPNLAPVNEERMLHIPQGGSWRDLPVRLLPDGMKRARRSDHTKRYGRLHPDGLSCTILTKCDLHWGAYIHPDQDRTITVRESARLQSFPDSFRFLGGRVEQYKQVGNAVPVLLSQAVGTAVQRMARQQRPGERIAKTA